METLELVASTAEAAFATDGEGRVVAWNEAAESLLGYAAEQAVGEACYRLLAGIDLFGNRYCDTSCPLLAMARRHEAVRHCQLLLRTASGQRLRVQLAMLAATGERPGELAVIHLLQPVAEEAPAASAPPPSGETLTPREREVLGLLAEGRDTRQIAAHLTISPATVRNHVQNLLHKLAAHSRLEAVSIARHRGLL